MIGVTLGSVPEGYVEEEASMSIKSFHLIKPLVTHLVCARPAPTDFAAEPKVT